MNNPTIDVNIQGDTKHLEIRTGAALTLREPVQIIINGDIESVARFIDKRTIINSVTNPAVGDIRNDHVQLLKNVERSAIPSIDAIKIQLSNTQLIDAALAIVITDKGKKTIELRVDPESVYGAKIIGTLLEAKELEIFEVNEEKYYTREQLIKLIRFNRLFFVDPKQHEALLGAFQKFSVKTYMEIEKENDERGNAFNLFKKTVNANVPLSFDLYMPIYKGQKKERFTVDICIESSGNGVLFYFESIQLKELLETRLEEIFAKQLDSCVEFPIIQI